jgi:Ala-tRNA(Pro) deacylase
MYVGEVTDRAPEVFRTGLQRKVYEMFAETGVPFRRADTGDVVTMEDCEAVDRKMDMKMVKTLFLCDKKRKHFFIYVMPGDRRFSSSAFSSALGTSSVSFAPAETMREMLDTDIGAATVLSALVLDKDSPVRVVIDSEVLGQDCIGCSDGTVNSFLKIRTADLTGRILPYAGRGFEVVEAAR